MTHERLETLRYIARCGAVTASAVSSALGIKYFTAVKRLETLRESRLVRSEIDLIIQKEFGPVHLNWSLTKKGQDKLKYYETHLREVA
jgi:predicted ArsR family transcriptional regulator